MDDRGSGLVLLNVDPGFAQTREQVSNLADQLHILAQASLQQTPQAVVVDGAEVFGSRATALIVQCGHQARADQIGGLSNRFTKKVVALLDDGQFRNMESLLAYASSMAPPRFTCELWMLLTYQKSGDRSIPRRLTVYKSASRSFRVLASPRATGPWAAAADPAPCG